MATQAKFMLSGHSIHTEGGSIDRYIPRQFLWFARRSLGPFRLVPARSTLTVYPPPTVPGDRSVIVPFWSVRYHGTPARR